MIVLLLKFFLLIETSSSLKGSGPNCYIPQVSQFYNSNIFSFFRIMPMRVLILLPLLCYSMLLSAQTYGDYIGGGHDQNITVTTSSDFQPPGWEEVAEGSNTLAIQGLTGKLIDAGRFLVA